MSENKEVFKFLSKSSEFKNDTKTVKKGNVKYA